MMKTLLAAASAAVLLAACSQPPTKPVRTPAAAPGAASPPTAAAGTPAAPAGAMSLGLTVAQLENADLITPAGVDLGDVQRVDMDASGVITGLIVEPEGEGGPRWVRVSLDGLTPRQEGDDYDLVSNMTLAQLKALPAWAP